MTTLFLAVDWSQWLTAGLLVLFLFICVVMILTVLIQRPQGGGLVGAFGSGAGSGQTAFGAKTGDALTIATITIFVVYIVIAVVLNYMVQPPKAVTAAPPGISTGADPAPVPPSGSAPTTPVAPSPTDPSATAPAPLVPPAIETAPVQPSTGAPIAESPSAAPPQSAPANAEEKPQDKPADQPQNR